MVVSAVSLRYSPQPDDGLWHGLDLPFLAMVGWASIKPEQSSQGYFLEKEKANEF